MKAVCAKHGMAYEVTQGCLYCEPASTEHGLMGDAVELAFKDDYLVRVRGANLWYTETSCKHAVSRDGVRYFELKLNDSHRGRNQFNTPNPLAAFFELARGLGLEVCSAKPVTDPHFDEIIYNYLGHMMAKTWFGFAGSYYSHEMDFHPRIHANTLFQAFWASRDLI